MIKASLQNLINNRFVNRFVIKNNHNPKFIQFNNHKNRNLLSLSQYFKIEKSFYRQYSNKMEKEDKNMELDENLEEEKIIKGLSIKVISEYTKIYLNRK